LQNLRCPSLTHFRWYKDTFLSRVFQVGNSNSTHWKSKFIDGLPHLFAEKVRQALRNKNDGININFYDLTYGQIISTCLNEGLSLCNDIKLKNQLKNQLKKQNLTSKHQLGEFCEQFAFDVENPLKDKSKKGKSPSHKHKNKGIQNSGKYQYKRKRRKPYPKPPKDKGYINPKKRKAKKLDITCHKRGKPGHYANQCRVKKTLNEIEDENLRGQLEKILLISSDSENNNSTEEDIISNSSDSSIDDIEDNCQCNELNYWKFIVEMNGLNVLTKDHDEALKAIESISDNNLKRKMLEILIKDNTRDNTLKITEAPYQLSEVLS
ncbi:hypothetical protein A2U01_0015930, partial [Trifolium medium]|nr:hypothetical protein [Trifolium medium]